MISHFRRSERRQGRRLTARNHAAALAVIKEVRRKRQNLINAMQAHGYTPSPSFFDGMVAFDEWDIEE